MEKIGLDPRNFYPVAFFLFASMDGGGGGENERNHLRYTIWYIPHACSQLTLSLLLCRRGREAVTRTERENPSS